MKLIIFALLFFAVGYILGRERNRPGVGGLGDEQKQRERLERQHLTQVVDDVAVTAFIEFPNVPR